MLKQLRAFFIGMLFTIVLFYGYNMYARFERMERFMNYLAEHLEVQ